MSLEYVYSAGTVSVGNGSTSVTGTGTQWVAAGIREGDDFRANGLVATIASVNSNTSITLKNGWPGSSISSGDYSIRQYDNADRSLPAFNNLLLALGSGTLTSLAGLSASANQMPYFSGSGVMALTGLTSQARTLLGSTLLSRSGNNLVTAENARFTGGAVIQDLWDETDGRLLTTGAGGILGPAPVVDSAAGSDFDNLILGGKWTVSGEWENGPAGPGAQYPGVVDVTRRRFSAGVSIVQKLSDSSNSPREWVRVGTGAPPVYSPWARIINTLNCVGTVSQSDGVPTGAVIERGSNANGEYVRFADGTQICTNANAAITTNPAAFSGPITSLDGNKLRIGRWF